MPFKDDGQEVTQRVLDTSTLGFGREIFWRIHQPANTGVIALQQMEQPSDNIGFEIIKPTLLDTQADTTTMPQTAAGCLRCIAARKY